MTKISELFSLRKTFEAVTRKEEKVCCHDCKKSIPEDLIYRFSWRYNDKEKVYKTSQKKFIMTGYKYLCESCLTKITT